MFVRATKTRFAIKARKPPDRPGRLNIILRLPLHEDAHDLYKNYLSDVDCARYLKREPHQSEAQTRALIRKFITVEVLGCSAMFAWVIACRSNNKVIGMVTCIPNDGDVEIHYGLARAYWGQGLAVEAVQLACEQLANSGRFQRVFTVCPADHLRSRRVLEKAGFSLDKLLPAALLLFNTGDKPQDGVLYLRELIDG